MRRRTNSEPTARVVAWRQRFKAEERIHNETHQHAYMQVECEEQQPLLLPATRGMDGTYSGAGGASLRVQLEINTD